ncbi:MAG: surface lipoprotein assembly modifier, partial [Pseudomonadota bacterium]
MYENHEFKAANVVVAPAYEYAFPDGRWQAGPYFRYYWSGGDQSYFATGTRAALVHRVTDSLSVENDGRAEQRTFRDQSFRDGMFSSSGIRLRQQIDPSFSVNAGIAVDRDSPKIPYQRYRGARASVGMLKRWQGGFDTRASLEIGYQLIPLVQDASGAGILDHIAQLRR